jgi:hypothetical protein
MKPMIPFAIAGVLLAGAAGAAALALGGDGSVGDGGVSFETTGTVPAWPVSYTLAANGSASACSVTRGQDRGGGVSDLTVSPSCASVLPGLEKASRWKERDDGSVAFSVDGRDIVTFSLADGVDYESFKPATPVMTLAAVR